MQAIFTNTVAKVMADIDLGGSSNNWIPIANKNLIFKGTFEGNNKTISGLYINTSNDTQGLFVVTHEK